MDFKFPKEVFNILDKFQKANYQIYIVGGAVRDLLMEKGVKDWDFTTDAKPEEILKIFPEGVYGNSFGTVIIPEKNIHYDKGRDQSLVEITTMRKEGDYRDYRHPTNVSWTDKIADDLSRRDFTINAIALSVILGSEATPEPNQTRDSGQAHLAGASAKRARMTLVDPFSGQQDIKNKLIKAVGNPNLRFEEDALRLMRAIRFSTQLGFNIEEKTFEAIKQNASLIKNIAWERIRDELFKILAAENSYDGILKLREAGILQIILPELEKCFGLKQEGPKHSRVYDIGEHSLLTLKYCPAKDPLTRLASLLHDVGKPDTVTIDKTGNVTFYNHDVYGGRKVTTIARRFNLSNKQADKLYRLVRWHMFSVSENQTDSAIRRFIKNAGIENLDDMMALRIGDRLGGGTQKEVSWRMEKFQQKIAAVLKKPFTISDLKINGHDVMKVLNIKPGPKVGEILNKLFEEVLKDSSKNRREYLLGRIKVYAPN
ncbi:CCA tRNA nucleotidyltransferase [Candidatus Daviesbacteria bacterium]|nr:CCA tRNA nucleotidyltransferase [Candidatus Daviesbacteria bacterium]